MPEVVRNPDLHAAVLAAPDDDVPRLVYADWLMERGDPRGELIALQVERGTLHAVNPRAAVLMGREKALTLTNYKAWQARLPQPCRFAFERGFVEKLGCAYPALTAASLEDACVRELQVEGGEGLGRHVAPLLSVMAIRTLEISGEVQAHDLLHLRSPHLDRLVTLRLLDGVPTEGHIRAIHAGTLGRATDLELANVRGDGLTALADGPPLRRLVLTGGNLGGIARYLRSPAFAGLTCLHLRGVALTPSDVTAVVDAMSPSVVDLDLSFNLIDPAGVWRIASEPRFAALRRLGLAYTRLSPSVLAPLFESAYLSRELELVIDGDALGMRRDRYLRTWPHPVPPRYAARFRVTLDDSAFTRT